jgi:hypothetical protein
MSRTHPYTLFRPFSTPPARRGSVRLTGWRHSHQFDARTTPAVATTSSSAHLFASTDTAFITQPSTFYTNLAPMNNAVGDSKSCCTSMNNTQCLRLFIVVFSVSGTPHTL